MMHARTCTINNVLSMLVKDTILQYAHHIITVVAFCLQEIEI